MVRVKQPLAVIVGANITALRKKKNLNQSQLAELLNIGPDSLSRIERGLTAPRFNTLEKLGSILECPVSEFFTTDSENTTLSFKTNLDTQENALREIIFMAEKILQIARDKI